MTAWQESTKDPALKLEGVLNEAPPTFQPSKA